MGKKDNVYILLSNLDHKSLHANIVAVISEIKPVISRSHILCSVELELSDNTMYNPGFTVKLKMETQVLSKFLDVSKVGLIVELLEMQILKNDGVVYGEMYNEDMVKLYNDNELPVKWHSERDKYKVSDKLKLSIKSVLQWKKANFSSSTEAFLLAKDLHTVMRRSRASSSRAAITSPDKQIKLKDRLVDISDSNMSFDESPTIKRRESKNENLSSISKRRKDLIETGSPSRHNKSKKEDSESDDVQRGNTSKRKSSANNVQELKRLRPQHIKTTPNHERSLRSCSNSPLKSDESSSIKSNDISSSAKSTPKSKEKEKNSTSLSTVLLENKLLADIRTRRSTCQQNKNGETRDFPKEDSKGENNKLRNTAPLDQVSKIKDNQKKEKPKDEVRSNRKGLRNKIVIDENIIKNEKILRSKIHEKQTDSPDKQKPELKESLVRTRSNSSLPGKNMASKSNERITRKVKDTSLILDSKKDVKNKPTTTSTSPIDLGKERRTRQSKSSSSDSIELIDEVISNTCKKSSPVTREKKLSETCKHLRKNESFSPKTPDSSIERNSTSTKVRKNPMLTSCDSTIDGSSDDSSISSNSSTSKKPKIVQKSPASPRCNKKIKTHDDSMKDKSIEMISTTRNESIEVLKIVKQIAESVRKNNAGNIEVKKNSREDTKEKDASKCIEIKSTSIEPKVDNVHDNVLKNLRSKSLSTVEVTSSSSPDSHKDDGINKCVQPKRKLFLEKKENSPTINSPIRRNKTPDSANLSGGKQNLTRNLLSKINKVKDPASKLLKKTDSVFRYLALLTRDVNWHQVHGLGDISIYDLEQIDCTEKFDLECKIVSKFALIEDDIEVLRVQDGTLCPSSTLVVPQCPTWNDITESILKNPILEKESPFVDIILFNSSRMGGPIVPNKFYTLHNVMAIKFQLKDDPRKKDKPKLELFFCAEGQNIYMRRLPKEGVEQIEKKISTEKYKSALQEKDVGGTVEKSIVHTSLVEPKSPKDVLEENTSKSNLSHETQKRQLDYFELDTEVETAQISEKSRETEGAKNISSSEIAEGLIMKITDNGKRAERDENVEVLDENNRFNSSDETLLDETPSLLRELREIEHEQSLQGLTFTQSEDVHLRNTGSEVTFSQFCKEADKKALNFRTSTQNESPSKDIVPGDDLETSLSDKIDKMEPLVYCPSSSSASSAVVVSPGKHENKLDQDKIESSPSVLEDGTASKKSKDTLNCSKKKNENTSNKEITAFDTSSLSSIKVLSSNSSDSEIELIKENNLSSKKKTQADNEVSNLSNKKTPDSKIGKSSKHKPFSKSSGSANDDVTRKRNFDKVTDEDGIDDGGAEEIILSDNSSNPSFFSVASENEPVFNRRPVLSTPLCKQPRLVENKTTDLHWYNVEENLLKIPDECLFQSTTQILSLEQDEINSYHNDENSCIKFFSYSHDTTLPFLTGDVIFSLADTNCLTTTVSLINISPALKDVSQESFIKSRCPNCHKLFNVYNTADNQSSADETSTDALIVGSHTVCPESECCNQILEKPEFYFDVDLKLKDGSQLKSLIGDKYAEDIFGCTAQDALKNEPKFRQVTEVLKKISTKISGHIPIKVDLTRENICDPKSGPLLLKKIYL